MKKTIISLSLCLTALMSNTTPMETSITSTTANMLNSTEVIVHKVRLNREVRNSREMRQNRVIEDQIKSRMARVSRDIIREALLEKTNLKKTNIQRVARLNREIRLARVIKYIQVNDRTFLATLK